MLKNTYFKKHNYSFSLFISKIEYIYFIKYIYKSSKCSYAIRKNIKSSFLSYYKSQVLHY